MFNKLTPEIKKGLVLKFALLIIVVALLFMIFGCNRPGHQYWNGILMDQDFIPPPQEKTD